MTVPWHNYPTRADCLNAFLDEARNHFEIPLAGYSCSQAQKTARSQILSLLQDTGLFGFIEPQPEVSQRET